MVIFIRAITIGLGDAFSLERDAELIRLIIGGLVSGAEFQPLTHGIDNRAVVVFPAMVGLLTDAVGAANVGDLLAGPNTLEQVDDLLF